MSEVKEIAMTLNTMTSGKVELDTKKINGVLKAFIIDCNEKIQVRITLEEYEKIVLFEDADFYGCQYLPITTEKVLKRNEKLKYESEEWVLNDKLKILIRGPFNANINIKVRYM